MDGFYVVLVEVGLDEVINWGFGGLGWFCGVGDIKILYGFYRFIGF